MKSISIDNGNTFYTGGQERALSAQIIENWDQITNLMDDDARERAHAQFDEEGDELDFLNLYLSLAPADLILP